MKEREEISKNLHNSIGHTVSASILELHALNYMTDDEHIKNELGRIRENLSNGMVEIRQIIHNMYKSSFDIESSIGKLLELNNVKTKFIFKIQNEISNEIRFDILNIVKECVANFIKHSNGDEFTVKIIENEEHYILTVFDNGTSVSIDKNNDGLGLLSIKEIAQKYNTNLNIITDKGFKINIAFRKENKI